MPGALHNTGGADSGGVLTHHHVHFICRRTTFLLTGLGGLRYRRLLWFPDTPFLLLLPAHLLLLLLLLATAFPPFGYLFVPLLFHHLK
jgi:hypothetical protein